ncbi:hypothetical protein Tco_1142934 [Tanacetum coccineum]
MTHPHPNRRFVPQAVLTKSGKINTAGTSVNTACLELLILATHSRRSTRKKELLKCGCSRHMTGNKCYLDEYEDYDGGFVSFGNG